MYVLDNFISAYSENEKKKDDDDKKKKGLYYYKEHIYKDLDL